MLEKHTLIGAQYLMYAVVSTRKEERSWLGGYNLEQMQFGGNHISLQRAIMTRPSNSTSRGKGAFWVPWIRYL